MLIWTLSSGVMTDDCVLTALCSVLFIALTEIYCTELSDTSTSPIGLCTCQGQELSRRHELIREDDKKLNWG